MKDLLAAPKNKIMNRALHTLIVTPIASLMLIAPSAWAAGDAPPAPPKPPQQGDMKNRTTAKERGQIYWTPISARHITFRVVYNNSLTNSTSPSRHLGIYRRAQIAKAPPALRDTVEENLLLPGNLQPLPFDASMDLKDLSVESPYVLPRPDYALVSNIKKDLYILTENGIAQINRVPVENVSAILNKAHMNRHLYDIYFISNANKQVGELLVIRDDGQVVSAGSAAVSKTLTIKVQGRNLPILIVNGQPLQTPEDYKALIDATIDMAEANQKPDQSGVDRSRALAPIISGGAQHHGPTAKGGATPENSDFMKGIEDVDVMSAEGKSESAKNIVKVFVTDVVAELKAKADENINVDANLEAQIARGLLKRERGSVAFLGEAGVGKSTNIRGLIYDIHIKKKPELQALQEYTFLEVSPSALGAGNKFVGAVDTKINAMIQLSRKNKIIWVLDEMHVLRGMGTSSNDSNDVLDFMMKPLSDGTLRTIGITTPDSFWAMFGGDPGLRRRFTIVERKNPDQEEVLHISQSWVKRFNLSAASDDVLKEAIRIAAEMDPTRAQPDATISLLEEAYADKRLTKATEGTPLELKDLQQAAVRLYSLDPSFMTPSRQKDRFIHLKSYLDENIIGQDLAKKMVLDLTEQILADVHDNSKPRIMAMLTGKKGLGKTEFVLAYAKALGLPIEIIEMNSFNSPRSGFDRMGLMEALANAINKSPFVVIGFDEFEKAPIAVQNELLRMLNNGEFTVTVRNKGETGTQVSRKIDARKTSIFFTANAGQEYMREKARPSIGFVSNHNSEAESTRSRNLREALEADNLSNVVLDRVNAIIPFIDTSREEFKNVIALHLRKTIHNLGLRNKKTISVENEAGFLEFSAQRLYHENVSNRDALRAVQDDVRQVIARALLGVNGTTKVVLKFEGTGFVAELTGESCTELLKGAK